MKAASIFAPVKLYLKNMVCDRCVLLVRQQLDALGIPYDTVELGEVSLRGEMPSEKAPLLRDRLQALGFEWLDDRKASLISRIKSAVIRHVHGEEDRDSPKKLSVLLSEKLGTDYAQLSALFSATEGITLEKYVILQRIERAKELLEYNELELQQIADRLGYSSLPHFSQQFKKLTGLTPTQYRQARASSRKPLDQVGS